MKIIENLYSWFQIILLCVNIIFTHSKRTSVLSCVLATEKPWIAMDYLSFTY